MGMKHHDKIHEINIYKLVGSGEAQTMNKLMQN